MKMLFYFMDDWKRIKRSLDQCERVSAAGSFDLAMHRGKILFLMLFGRSLILASLVPSNLQVMPGYKG
jgi:hypothetical protein